MRTLSNDSPKGMSRQAIRIWGLLFLAAGAVGQGILMNVMLGMKGQSNDQILAALNSGGNNMTYVILALLSQLAYACAIPVYTFLLVDGFRRTSRIRDYALRLTGVALLAEIPYNLVMSGVWFDFGSRNPMVAMVLGVAVGLVGMVLVALAYPIYNQVLKKQREKIAPEILRLSDELLK